MTKTNATYTSIYPDNPSAPGDAVLDIITSTRYWRTSRIEQIELITCHIPSEADKLCLRTECDEDEPRILEKLVQALAGVSRIITYNGHSFDLPHLHHKYRAYQMEDPLEGKAELDLYHELKDLVSFFAIPSRRLVDAADFLHLSYPKHCTDAEAAWELMSLLRYKEFLLSKEVTIQDLSTDGERIIFKLSCPYRFPKTVSVHDGIFHIRFLESGEVLLSARIIEGCLRYYHTDIHNYEYLPMEGYAIHRSAASFVEKTRREKASRETCFHLVPYSEEIRNDPVKIKAYLLSVLSYLAAR